MKKTLLRQRLFYAVESMSLRTSDRRHWCGNPFSFTETIISVRRRGMRIATPVCALARNDNDCTAQWNHGQPIVARRDSSAPNVGVDALADPYKALINSGCRAGTCAPPLPRCNTRRPTGGRPTAKDQPLRIRRKIMCVGDDTAGAPGSSPPTIVFWSG